MHRFEAFSRVMSTVAVVCAALVVIVSAPVSGQTGAPDGVDILLPRGGIPAVFNPQFVGAAEADIPDDAWILGVLINGEARAYDLNLLNHHEIVNDEVGGTPVAAVW